MNFFNSQTKTIAIVGATGAQGGATVKAFHALKEAGNTEFKVRAITRDPTSDKAKAIEPFTEEIIKADADDLDSMVEAFKDCYGAYLVSDFWQDMDVDHEMQSLRNLLEAAKKAGVKHIVLSTLESTKDFVNNAENKDTWKLPKGHEATGMYVPHFDSKADVTKEFEDQGLPITKFLTSFYYENFIYFGMGPARQSDSDPYAITLPMADAKLPMIAVADIGKSACAIFQDESLIGKTVGAQSDLLTGPEIADVFSKVCGQTVVFNAVPWDVYASFGFPGADDLANMFRFKVENAETFQKNREVSDDFLEKMGGVTLLEEWVTANKGAFQLEEQQKKEEVQEKKQEQAPMDSEGPRGECCSSCVIS